MKNKYLILYQFRSEDYEYMEFYFEIKNNFKFNFHITENAWVIVVEDGLNANEIYEKLSSKVSQRDTLLVMKLDNDEDFQGFAPKSFYDFMKFDFEREKNNDEE